MKVTSLHIIFVLVLSSMGFSQVNFQKIPIVDAAKMAGDQGKIVFVEFTAEGCPPCLVLEREVFANSEFGKLINENFVAVKSDGTSVNSKFEKMRHKITAFPTVIYFDTTGTEIFRVIGRKSLQDMTQITNLILKNQVEKAKELFPFIIEEENIFSDDQPLKKPEEN